MFEDTAGQVPGQKVTAEYQGPRENPGLQEQSRDIAHDLRSKESPKEIKQQMEDNIKWIKEAEKLLSDAQLLEEAGCFALVLEKVPAKLAKRVSENVSIPIIGIGAGPDVDGQVLVLHDMLGMTHEFNPRFLRRYLNLYDEISGAVKNYVSDVKQKNFPNESEQY